LKAIQIKFDDGIEIILNVFHFYENALKTYFCHAICASNIFAMKLLLAKNIAMTSNKPEKLTPIDVAIQWGGVEVKGFLNDLWKDKRPDCSPGAGSFLEQYSVFPAQKKQSIDLYGSGPRITNKK
jgi:hypothetical protein